MRIVIIVNIIVSIGILLGGLEMKKRAESYKDFAIGFRTKRAMSGEDAWRFANQKCGTLWSIIGLIGFILTVAAIFTLQTERTESVMQSAILVFLIAAAILSAIEIEKQLKHKYDDNR